MSEQSSRDRGRAVLGIILVVAGVLSFLGMYTGFSVDAWVWIIALAAAAVLFAFVYSRGRELWALILAYVFGAVSILVLLLTQFNMSGEIVPVVVLLGVSVPFIVAWTQHRAMWGLLVPPYIMLAVIPILLFPDNSGDLVPAYVLGVVGAPFVLVAVLRRQWPLLVPGGILWLIAAIFLFSGWDIFGNVMGVIGQLALPLALLIIGVYLFLGSYRGDGKTRHEEEKPKREDGLDL